MEEKVQAPPRLNSWGNLLLPSLIGIVGFLMVLGWRILVPTNIAWMMREDPASYYLGWLFFLHTPWALPPGSNPQYGLEVGSSIFYTDSIPLVAILCKAMAGVLSNPFQYWGLWLMLCFVLQGIFGWKLSGLITRDYWMQSLMTGFFVFAPPFLFRLNGHYALCAHWLLLASLYLGLNFKLRHRMLLWPLLGFLGAGIHSYLLAMIIVLWLSDVARRLLSREFTGSRLIVESGLFGIGTLGMLWADGFFMVRNGLAPLSIPYGISELNLLALINPKNPQPFPGGKWSYLIPGLPSDSFDYEGFSFFGLGLLLLSAFFITQGGLKFACLNWRREWLALALACIGFTIFALSNHVALGHWKLVTYPAPDAFNMLRASGRMFWPVWYLGLLILFAWVVGKNSRQVALVVLAATLFVQMLDTSAGWLIVRQNRNRDDGSTWMTPLVSDFWAQAATHYRTIYLLPIESSAPGYASIAYFAGTHHMGTNACYLARFDAVKMNSLRQAMQWELATGNYRTDSLYILDSEGEGLAEKSYRPDKDLLEKINGFAVLAPGWKTFPSK